MLTPATPVLLTAALLGPGPAQDETETAAPPGDASEAWSFTVTPYLWLINMDGQLRVDNTTADVDIDFSDLEDDLELGAMVHTEAWKAGSVSTWTRSTAGSRSRESRSVVTST